MTDLGHIFPPVLPADVVLGVTLDRYQELMRLPIAAFNGLNRPEEIPVYECSTIWKQSERNALMLALAQAEEMREQELGYHIAPKYNVLDQLEYNNPLILDLKHVIKLGIRTITDIELDVDIDYGTLDDPVIVTVTTTVTDPSEIKVYFHGETYEIRPSAISISGGTATIKIPRSRLVKPELQDDRDDHLYYNDDDNFIETLDVKRVYYDETNPGYYGWIQDCSVTTLTSTTQTAYMHIDDRRRAIISNYPAAYAGGVWTVRPFSVYRRPDSVTVYAYTGRTSSVYSEMATIRLAHTLMPNAPCSCPTVHQYWEEDIKESTLQTPYGNSAGASTAWIMDSRAKVGQGGKFPRM